LRWDEWIWEGLNKYENVARCSGYVYHPRIPCQAKYAQKEMLAVHIITTIRVEASVKANFQRNAHCIVQPTDWRYK